MYVAADYVFTDANSSDIAYRFLRIPGSGLLHDDHNPPLNHCFCMDFLCFRLGANARRGRTIWHLWNADGSIFPSYYSSMDLWEEIEDCHSLEGRALDLSRSV
jgi:hypothetical protein